VTLRTALNSGIINDVKNTKGGSSWAIKHLALITKSIIKRNIL
jgi:hypothetical protein